MPPSASGVQAVADGRVLLDAGTLKRLRKKQGLSQETLAEACIDQHLCVSIASIKRAETGKAVLYRTARHLAVVFSVDVESLLARAAVETAVISPLVAASAGSDEVPAASEDSDIATIRYVLELGFEAQSDDDTLAQLIQQFGGVMAARMQHTVIARFGSPHAYRSDGERSLLCALALSRDQHVLAGHAMTLRLLRSDETAADADEAGTGLPGADLHGNAPVYVAHNLIEQLFQRFEFLPAEAAFPDYRRCLRQRNPDENAQRALAGRAIEILQFKGVIEATQECQDGHVVYVRGMVGIGKTHLVTEFAEIARHNGFACHRADVPDFGMDKWFFPLGQLVRSVLGLPAAMAEADDDTLPAALAAAALQLKLPAEHHVFLLVLAGANPARDPFREQFPFYAAMSNDARTQALLTAVLDLLLRAAMQRALLVCIEDLHWGDAALYVALGKLIALTGEAPIIWLLTARNEGDPLEHALRPHFASALSLLELAPMRQREAAALADQFADADPHYKADCIRRAQGNPLYLTQLLSSNEGTLPDSLRHLIQTRVDRLNPVQQRALRCAAVFGNRFELMLLREALRQPDYLPEAGMRQGLFREAEPGCYLFVHDLVMHCIYDAMPQVQREQLHRDVAGVFRQRDLALHARHLLRAGDDAAFDALLAAVQEKMQAYLYAHALELARLCEHFAVRSASSFLLALLCGQASAGMGHSMAARRHFELALALAGQPGERIEAALGLAPVLNTLDCLDEEERLIIETVPLARAMNAHTALARLFQLRGNIYFPRGDYAQCRHLHEEALQFARVSLHLETEAKALSGIGDSYYAEGRMHTAYEVFDQCVRLCERNGLANVEAGSRSARGSANIYLGQPIQALHDATEAIACSHRIGDRRAEVFSRLTASWVLMAAAQDDAAQEQLSTALTLAQSIGASRFEAMVLEGLARLALRRGEQAQAMQLIAAAVELVERMQLQRYIGPWVYGSMALIATDAATRQHALQQGELQLAQGGVAHNALRFRVAAAEVCLLRGDYVQVARHRQGLLAVAAAPCAWVEQHVQWIDVAGRYLQSADEAGRQALQALASAAKRNGFVATMPRLMHLLGMPG
ncbi:hypothetical protein IGB42_00994 [Andreprevotia sp. IGB-42]|uniref:helix-turn-helix domain-containing protein n=1 Tax=Andreprevotia sp. IGB-42 TaxID=2497473 RepID=UPI0013592EE3|nr:helix-turn-helix domain-containing protein [Andreprevotia sp. IGB-42]KAF0814097.1 hypothetical protein IGB42_00994 [Andreprevotia sp. IGB-42]